MNEYGISTTEICFPMYRRLWNWFEYIFFFYNAIVGIVASIFRVVLSVTINLLLLFRLDAVIFMKGFEFMDAGMSCPTPWQSYCLSKLASSPGHSQILSRSRGEKSGEGLVPRLRHGPEMVDSVST